MSERTTANPESMGIQARLVELESIVAHLFKQSEVRRQNDSFTPLSKQPFLRDKKKMKSLLDKPIVLNALYGMHRAIVVNTKDPMHKGRVQAFNASVHANITPENLPWAEVASFFGSLDEQGAVFTPPAGSTVMIEFEAGNRENPVVVGAIHNVTRQRFSPNEGGLLIAEERKLWGGAPGIRRNDKNPAVNEDPRNLMPPWRGESYDGPDELSFGAGYSRTEPHIYGIKTPQKSFIQFHDGNPSENLKGKRVVLQTSKGSTLFMKDDSYWTPEEIFDNPYWTDFRDAYPGLRYSARPFNDHKIELLNTGVQLQSVGGGRLIISDELERPQQANGWTTGFTQIGPFRSFTTLQSITEHMIVLSDHEFTQQIRSVQNGIFLVSACGHFIGMRDHTRGANVGDSMRQIELRSTSNHSLVMNDYTVQNGSPRRGVANTVKFHPGRHTPNARRAYVELRSGWGQLIRFDDFGSQENNARQYILIRNHNKVPNNNCPGPPWNYIRMECVASDKRFTIFAAGSLNINVCNNATRHVYRGSDLVYVERGSHAVVVKESSAQRSAKTGITDWTEFGIIRLLVGRMFKNRLEFPDHPVIIAKDFFQCPFTQHVHFDTPSRHVTASE